MRHSETDIRIAKYRVKLKRALRKRYVPFNRTMSTKNLERLINLLNIKLG